MQFNPLHLGPSDIIVGCDYLAVSGDWIYHVERRLGQDIFFTVVQTGQQCECHLYEFAQRVLRRMDYAD